MLVTRPQPDNEATAASLRAKGFEVLLAPMLRFEAVPFAPDADVAYGGIIVTSANALRAIEGQDSIVRLLKLPLFAVGARTARAATEVGFDNVIVAGGDASALRGTIVAAARGRKLKKTDPLLYLSGADIARDLPGELRALGFNIATQTAYKMVSVPALPGDVCDAFAANRIEAVLHYSGRSARSFLDAARAAGIEISALAIPQYCLSEAVAAVVHEAGAARVIVASSPNEAALFEVLDRAIGSSVR